MSLDLRLPLRIRQLSESFGIDDATGTLVCYVYFDDGCQVRREVRKRMTREQAEEVAKITARALTAAIKGQTPE